MWEERTSVKKMLSSSQPEDKPGYISSVDDLCGRAQLTGKYHPWVDGSGLDKTG